MHWVEKPGTSLEAMRRITAAGQRGAAGDPGRAELRRAHRPGRGGRRGRRHQLHRAVDQPRSVGGLRGDGREGPGGRGRLSGPAARPADVPARAHQGSADGASATIVVRIYGPDLDVLQRKAAEVGKAIAGVERRGRPQGAGADARAADRSARSTATARSSVGVTPGDVRDAVATLVPGTKVGEVYEQQKIFDVVVWGTPDVRSDLVRAARGCRSNCRRRLRRRWRRSPTCASRRRRTRSRARAGRAGSTSRATCAAATWARSRATSRPRWRGVDVRRRLSRRSARRVRGARRRRSAGC